MNRRLALLAPLLAGCGLSERPYEERRQWPISLARPTALPPRANGKILEVRNVRAGPGLDSRGLQALQPDGSVKTGFYEEWSVPPAEGVEDAIRRWLADSGLFAAIIAPGSRATADLVLEGELDALRSEPAAHLAHAALAVTVIAKPGDAQRIVLQRHFSQTAALAGTGAPAEVQSMLAALMIVLAQLEAALRTSG